MGWFCSMCLIQMPLTHTVSNVNKLSVGCVLCPINSEHLTRRLRGMPGHKFEDIKFYKTGEWMALHALNDRFPIHPQKGMKSSRHIIKDSPKDEWVAKVRELLLFNLNVWKDPIARRLATDCVPLVVVTRRGQITATVARIIILMIGNCLINECEVFDKLVYTECEVVDGRFKV